MQKAKPRLAAQDFDQIIQENHQWLGEFIKGNVGPVKRMFSHRDDVTLAGPQPTAHRGTLAISRGSRQVADTLDSAILNFRDGELTSFENVAKYLTHDLACIVEIERFKAKVGASEDLAQVALRVTSIFRLEGSAWKLVHRHADPITSVKSPESIATKYRNVGVFQRYY